MTSSSEYLTQLAKDVDFFLAGLINQAEFADRVTALWKDHRDYLWSRDPVVTKRSQALVEGKLRGDIDAAEFNRQYAELWGVGVLRDAEIFDELHSLCNQLAESSMQGEPLDVVEFAENVRMLESRYNLKSLA